jgi:hypothetical protein
VVSVEEMGADGGREGVEMKVRRRKEKRKEKNN